MGNRNKRKGTDFETDLEAYIRERGHDAHRIALSGKNDCGDVYAEIGHRRYVIECKAHKSFTPAYERAWRSEAIAGCENYSARFQAGFCHPLLAVKQHGKSLGRSIVHFLDPDGIVLGEAVWYMQYLDEFLARWEKP
jgi:Holliday junction resolvase